ncbi:MAG: 2-aminoethylphosphonate ABC transporter substrate-binding protein [Mycobacterium sp.]|nr:2-aminoethylphosphonate ABC transporter substrate-binding protein [Mycobacterium sp.]
MTLRRALATVIAVAVVAAGCAPDGTSGSTTTVTVYSASGLGDWYRPQFEKFTRDTGVKVSLFEAGSGEVVSRVNSRAVWQQLDGDTSVPPADLLVTLPPFIQRAARAGLLQPGGADSSGIPGGVTDPDGLFVPIANTALCFIANPDFTPQPRTWDDLLDPRFKGKLQYSTPGEAGAGTALLLLLHHLMGERGALDYLAELQSNNVGPSPSTGELQPKVSSGQLLVANGDVQMNLSAITNDGLRLNVFFPAMSDNSRTTMAIPYAAGVTAATQRPREAKRLLAQLLSDEAQRALYRQAFGIPVRASIEQEMSANAGPGSPTEVLNGVKLWSPDWNSVVAQIDKDLEDYRRAIG